MLLRQSRWSYNTAATGGLGAGFIVAAAGNIDLFDPAARPRSFWYGGIGVGASVGLRLPKVKIPTFSIRQTPVAGVVAAKAFPSYGSIYMTGAFNGTELSREDLCGATLFIDGGLGLAAGLGGTAMILGINSVTLMAQLTSPVLAQVLIATGVLDHAIHEAPAVLVMGGINVGLQAGAGIGALLGYLR